ncbi:MAG: hypothetical protein K8S97_04300 [Anaerolineae bacterium]|nr:hypothetical protein [Anaerolineae bacterium]
MIQNLLSNLRNAPLSRALYRLIVRFIDTLPKHTPSHQQEQTARPVRVRDRRPATDNLNNFDNDDIPAFLRSPEQRRRRRAAPPPPPTAVPAGPPRRARTFYRQFLLPTPPPNTRTLTIFVRGARRAGKTTFIRTICDIEVQEFASRRLSGNAFSIEDFGRIYVHDDLVLDLIGTTDMQHDLQLPSHIRCDTYSGTIFLVDSTSSRYVQGMHEWWQHARQHTPPPYITALTKVDAEQPVPPDQLRRFANVPPDELMLPCIATRRASVHHVVSHLLDEILRWREA